MGLQRDAMFSLRDLGSGDGSVLEGDDGGPDISASSGCPVGSSGLSMLWLSVSVLVGMFCGNCRPSSSGSESERTSEDK